MRTVCLWFLVILVCTGCATVDSGIVRQQSAYSVAETTQRLLAVLEDKGLTHFATIDHAAGAQRVGQSLPPTVVVVFGNPKAGTPLMRCAQSVGLDLPQKALIYEDAAQDVWLSYNDPAYLAKRHSMDGCATPLANISAALAAFTAAATER
ncbi:MAG: DUF302 domain-containing protein [Pseudomonadota bacterium]